jgi:hypothetical protein
MNVPIFQWVAVSTYVTFIYPADLTRAWAWIRARVQPHLAEPVTVMYDGSSPQTAGAANVVRAIDVFGRVQFLDKRGSAQVSHGGILISTPAGPRNGLAGWSYLGRVVPLLWPLTPLSFVLR